MALQQDVPAPGPVWTGLSRLFTKGPERMVISIWQESCGFLPVGGMEEEGTVRIAPVVDGYFPDAEAAAEYSDQAMDEEGFEAEGTWSDAELGSKKKAEEPPRSKETEKWVSEIMHALKGPIIVYSEQWPVPDWIKRDMPMERLLKLMKDKEPGEATDLEALAYMYPAAIMHPMRGDFVNIYLWLGAKELKKRGMNVPEDTPKKLSDQEERELRKLKRWLHERYESAKTRKRRAEAHYPGLKEAA